MEPPPVTTPIKHLWVVKTIERQEVEHSCIPSYFYTQTPFLEHSEEKISRSGKREGTREGERESKPHPKESHSCSCLVNITDEQVLGWATGPPRVVFYSCTWLCPTYPSFMFLISWVNGLHHGLLCADQGVGSRVTAPKDVHILIPKT